MRSFLTEVESLEKDCEEKSFKECILKENPLKIIFSSHFIATSKYHQENTVDKASRFEHHQATKMMKESESLDLLRIQRRMRFILSCAGTLSPSKGYNL